MKATAQRPGRKAQPANQGKRASLGLKVTPGVKNKLDAAAKANGRTQSQEAEVRLEQSFARQQLLDEVLGLAYGRPLAGIVLAIAEAMRETAERCAFAPAHNLARLSEWASDPSIYDQVTKAAEMVLNGFRPPGEPSIPAFAYFPAGTESAELEAGEYRNTGENVAGEILQGTLTPDQMPAPSVLEIGKRVRHLLGDHLSGEMK